MSLIIMWWNIMVQWFPMTEIRAFTNSEDCGRFLKKLTSKTGTNQFFKIWAPMSLVKCPSPLEIKFHWAECVKGNYNWMEPIPISEKLRTNVGYQFCWPLHKWLPKCPKFRLPTLVLCLTHWGRDKMDAILQTPFSTAFPWLKMFEFRLKFHWNLFLGV